MQIERIIVGPLYTNCYLLKREKNVIIIDPGDDYELILSSLNGFNLKGILVTHHHDDHIGALEELEKQFNISHNIFNIEGFDFEVIKTPGHTDDSISFYFRDINCIFSGDFIFYHGIGRTDFGNSSSEDMKKSLQLISTYDDELIIFPGHGNVTSLKEEKQYFKLYF